MASSIYRTEPKTNGQSNLSAAAHGLDDIPYTLQRAALPSQIIASSHGGYGVPNTCFPGPTRVHNLNSISIGSAVFAQFMIVTDRQTDLAIPSVTIGLIYPVYV